MKKKKMQGTNRSGEGRGRKACHVTVDPSHDPEEGERKKRAKLIKWDGEGGKRKEKTVLKFSDRVV